MDLMQNVEIKARVASFDAIYAALVRRGAVKHGLLQQRDVFFAVEHGRLKLRFESQGQVYRVQLIHYQRNDTAALRTSSYELYEVDDAERLEKILSKSCGNLGEVRKRRELFTWKNVRIHLDDVDGLGRFLELEAMVDSRCPLAVCQLHCRDLLDDFAVEASQFQSGSYHDLLFASDG